MGESKIIPRRLGCWTRSGNFRNQSTDPAGYNFGVSLVRAKFHRAQAEVDPVRQNAPGSSFGASVHRPVRRRAAFDYALSLRRRLCRPLGK